MSLLLLTNLLRVDFKVNASVISERCLEMFSDLHLSVFCREEEGKPPKEKHDGKEKSSGGRRGGRYHPYKDKHGGEKKGAHRNRVFISNIPYDMKWQAIKDLMRDKGNLPSDGYGVFPSVSLQLIRRC